MTDISTYRKLIEAQVADAAQKRGAVDGFLDRTKTLAERLQAIGHALAHRRRHDIPQLVALVRDPGEDPEIRAEGLALLAADSREPQADPAADGAAPLADGPVAAALELLPDVAQPKVVRIAALHFLLQRRLSSHVLATHRPAFVQALRAVIDDPDGVLRGLALEALARERDTQAQGRLLAGLRDPATAAVPPAKAIQLLGYDIHGAHFSLLKDIVANPPDEAAKIEALRVLSADPSATELLVQVLRDVRESPEVRRSSGVALQALDRGRFEAEARAIALDSSQPEAVRAACISALDHFANPAPLQTDGPLVDAIRGITSESSPLGRAAARFYARRPIQ